MAIYTSPEEFRDANPYIRVVATSGGFDPMHVGHLRCLQESAMVATELDCALVVIVNADSFLVRKKGKPFMPQDERCEIISGVRGVEHVVLFESAGQTVDLALEKLRPIVFTKGGDRDSTDNIPESGTCDKIGCRILTGVGGGKIQSSSWLIENARGT
jgi:D-beta-D-heptose 7-phosphate kinase/D-beta-D-heptose 1-phosphate adenosyltransferase